MVDRKIERFEGKFRKIRNLCRRIHEELPGTLKKQERSRELLIEYLKTLKKEEDLYSMQDSRPKKFPESVSKIKDCIDIMRECGIIDSRTLSKIDMDEERWKSLREEYGYKKKRGQMYYRVREKFSNRDENIIWNYLVEKAPEDITEKLQYRGMPQEILEQMVQTQGEEILEIKEKICNRPENDRMRKVQEEQERERREREGAALLRGIKEMFEEYKGKEDVEGKDVDEFPSIKEREDVRKIRDEEVPSRTELTEEEEKELTELINRLERKTEWNWDDDRIYLQRVLIEIRRYLDGGQVPLSKYGYLLKTLCQHILIGRDILLETKIFRCIFVFGKALLRGEMINREVHSDFSESHNWEEFEDTYYMPGFFPLESIEGFVYILIDTYCNAWEKAILYNNYRWLEQMSPFTDILSFIEKSLSIEQEGELIFKPDENLHSQLTMKIRNVIEKLFDVYWSKHSLDEIWVDAIFKIIIANPQDGYWITIINVVCVFLCPHLIL